MTYSSKKVTKLEYASFLTAALSYLMLHQKDGIGLILFDQKIQSFIPPRSTSNHLNTILSQLDKIQPGEDTKIGDVLREMADRIKKRGLVILISDLFDDFDSVMSGLKHFRYNKQEVIVFHIMDRQELQFNFNSRTRFKDMESNEMITTEPWQIQKSYEDLVLEFQNKYRKNCRNRLIDYIPLFTDQNLDKAIKYAQLEKTIENLPNGINTKIGERGSKLSVGEIQRVGIARALSLNPRLIVELLND